MTSAATVRSVLNFFFVPFALPGFFFWALSTDVSTASPSSASASWMMTESVSVGLSFAFFLSSFGTAACFGAAVLVLAPAVAASARTTSASTSE